MTLVRPPYDQFQDDFEIRADCAVSTYGSHLLPKKLFPTDCQCGELAFGQKSALTPASGQYLKKNKLSFPPSWPVYWLLSGYQLDPTPFGNNINFIVTFFNHQEL